MLKYIIGPVLTGVGYAAGSYYGSDAEQLIHKSPTATYAALQETLEHIRPSGTTSFQGGTPVPYEVKVDRTLDQQLVIHLLFAGKQGAEADIDLSPRDNGNSTLITAHIHGDRSVLRPVLAGSDKARLGYAPDWMLNLTFKPLLQQLAQQIETGQRAAIPEITPADAEAQWETSLSDDQRNQLTQWRQYDATRPSTDLDTGSKDGKGADVDTN